MEKLACYICFILLLLEVSCDNVLDKKSIDSFNEDVVFSDIHLAKAFLGTCYTAIGPLGVHKDMLTSGTDQSLCTMRPETFVQLKGTMSPDQRGFFANTHGDWLSWGHLYSNIQNLNVFLSRIDKVPVITETEKSLQSQMKGEALFIRAMMYSYLLMNYGGVILSDKPYEITDEFSHIKRASIQDTKDFIVNDIDQAINLLPEKMEQGRATRAASAAMKSRLLLFCASKLTNGGFMPDNELVSFPAGVQTTLLEEARDAAKVIMDGKYGNFALVGNTQEPSLPLTPEQIQEYSDTYFNIFNQKEAWNSETIWGIQFPLKEGQVNQMNLSNGPNGYHNYGNNNPTEAAVRMFEMADGTAFVWDARNPENETVRHATAKELADNPLINPYNGREPRFYACILYHGAPWQQRPDDAVSYDPYNRIQTGHIYELDGAIRSYGVDTRQGPLDSWNGTKTGYFMKKFMDPETVGQSRNNTNTWVEFRYAEVLLNYAEACIELGGENIKDGLNALNLVRHRAGLPSRSTTSQEDAREFLRHERAIELFGEGRRFWDMRRWMICDEVIKDVHPMRIKEYVNGDMEWNFDYNTTEDLRSWKGDYFYWLPVPRDEINKVPDLQQNPGYN